MIDDYHIIERQKAKYREKIRFHTENVILQSMITFMCVTGGFYAGTKKSAIVPLFAYPTAGISVVKLAEHETKRRKYIKVLKRLERS